MRQLLFMLLVVCPAVASADDGLVRVKSTHDVATAADCGGVPGKVAGALAHFAKAAAN